MSKLDNYLISEGVLDLFPHLSALCLDRHLSDHRPILLRETNYDYVLLYFGFSILGLPRRVSILLWKLPGSTWAPTSSKLLIISVYAPQELNERRNLWDYLRTFINRWEGDTVIMGDFNEVRSEHERFGSTFNRQVAIAFNNFIFSTCSIDLPLEGYAFTWAHKSASKMSKLDRYLISEGDENSKYFHGIMNKKRSQIAIRGTLANGEWISEPHGVKNEFFTHFKKQFVPIQAPSICFDFTFPTRLSSDQVQDLKRTVTYEEVKRAVWDYGTNKSPGPDGFSFEFYRKYWTTIDDDIQDAKFVKDFRPISLIGSIYKIITKILANRLCVILPYLISDVQSDFVANRQILDGPFILNELLSWYKFKKLNGMIFKVDFKKAFDYVKWDYLDETLKAFGFGSKWRNWISSCFNNAMGSMLINGIPTLEFQFHKGLKQGISLNDSFTISHLFYADDIVFIGIGVSSNLVAVVASLIGCSILTAPFNCLGMKVGSNMSRITSWDDVIFKDDFWLGEVALKVLYKRMPRGGVKQEIYGLLCSKVADLVLPNISDRWCWSLEGSQDFSVKSCRILIDNTILPKVEFPTRWLRVVPIKINVHS
nr:hypothetical protein [Tanacetum cinerariifolium]